MLVEERLSPRANGYGARLSERLYGREREAALIAEAYHWATLGSTQMICVSGPSGIGKTALVQEATRKIAFGQAYVIAGKFEPLQQDKPMSPLIAAFRELTEQLLSEDKPSLDRWRNDIVQALGANAAVITEVIPEMERIVGQPASVEQLPLEEAMERFQFALRRFIQVFCRQKHPLVLFMDDLQWADEASWRMIRAIMTDPLSQSLLLIGAYRDYDQAGVSRIADELEAIASSGVSVQPLRLEPLALPELTHIVKDTLGVNREIADDIAHALFLKSQGNPFLFRRWLRRSLEEETLRYDDGQGWIWNWGENDPSGDPEHADLLFDYMMDSIDRLPGDTRLALLEASCLGSEFELGQLASWRSESAERTLALLRPAIDRQIIACMDEATVNGELPREAVRLRFVHDRLQEAANAMLDAEASGRVHWYAGNYWLDHPDPAKRERHLYDAAGHLNKGNRFAMRPEDADRLVRANAGAGRKAKSATAFEAALVYFRAAAASIGEEHWERDYGFCFDLMVDLLECEYMNGWQSSADAFTASLLRRSRNAYDSMRVQLIVVMSMLHTDRMAEGIALGMRSLRDLGFRVPAKSGKWRQLAEALFTRERLRRKIGRFEGQPSVTDPVVTLALQVLTQLSGSAFMCDRPLFRTLTYKCVRLSLKYGNFPQAAAVFGSFAGSINQAFGDRKLAHASLTHGMRIALAYNQPSILCRAYLTMGVMFFVMEDDYRDFGASLQKSIDYGLEAGDLFFVGQTVIIMLVNLHLTGKLVRLRKVLPEYRKLLLDTHNQYLLPCLTMIERWTQAMSGTEEEAGAVAGAEDSELLRQIGRSGMESNLLFLHGLCLLQEGFLLGRHGLAQQGIAMAGSRSQDATHYVQRSEFELFHGLELVSRWDSLQPDDKRLAASLLKRLRRSARKNAAHVRHKSLLLQAEYARVRGKREEAGRLYDEAIREAKRSGYAHHAAIGCECAVNHYLSQARETIAKGYLIEALTLYREWGASRKADSIRERYAAHYQELGARETAAAVEASALSADAAASEPLALPGALEFNVVQQAFQAMAAEADQRILIDRLARTVLEQAGAQKGCIVFEQAKRLVVELAIGEQGVTDRKRLPLERYDEVCVSAIRYTANTGEPLLLDNASASGRFARDPYVMSCQVRSMLCMPLYVQNELAAVLYLENNAKPGAFASGKLDMLRMLATQAVFLLKLFPLEVGRTTAALSCDNSPTDAMPSHAEPSRDVPGEAGERDAAPVGADPNAFAPVDVAPAEAAALPPPSDAPAALPMDPLTNRELEVLQLISLGLSNQEIAQQLHIAVGTVKLHTNRIFSKMNVNRRAKAVIEGRKLKLLDDGK